MNARTWFLPAALLIAGAAYWMGAHHGDAAEKPRPARPVALNEPPERVRLIERVVERVQTAASAPAAPIDTAGSAQVEANADELEPGEEAADPPRTPEQER
jgi:hypothetical protein